jgi:hypothetical protein
MQLLNEVFDPEDLDESKASEEAERLGLTYMSFGRYGKNGKVTHKSVGGKLKAIKGSASTKRSSSRVTIGKSSANADLSRAHVASGANTRGPNRNVFARMQYDIATSFGDIDRYHFHASGGNSPSKFHRDELRYGKSVVRDIDKEMKKVATRAKKYIAALKAMRANMVKSLRKK